MIQLFSNFFHGGKPEARDRNAKLLTKYQKSGLTFYEATQIKEKVYQAFERDKVYKDNEMGLNTLANHIRTDRYKVSQVINEHIALNFYSLLNQYRLKDAKKLLTENPDLSVKTVMYQVGFNSKTCFYGAFKKETGLSPNKFRNLARHAS